MLGVSCCGLAVSCCGRGRRCWRQSSGSLGHDSEELRLRTLSWSEVGTGRCWAPHGGQCRGVTAAGRCELPRPPPASHSLGGLRGQQSRTSATMHSGGRRPRWMSPGGGGWQSQADEARLPSPFRVEAHRAQFPPQVVTVCEVLPPGTLLRGTVPGIGVM